MPMSHDQGVELGEDLLDWNQSQIKQIFLHLLCLFLVSKRRIAISFDCFDCRLKRRSRQEQELGQAFSSQTGQAWRFNLFISFPPNVLSLSVSAIVKQKFEPCTEIQTFASTLSVLRWPWLSKALIWRHRICEPGASIASLREAKAKRRQPKRSDCNFRTVCFLSLSRDTFATFARKGMRQIPEFLQIQGYKVS